MWLKRKLGQQSKIRPSAHTKSNALVLKPRDFYSEQQQYRYWSHADIEYVHSNNFM